VTVTSPKHNIADPDWFNLGWWP